MKNSSKLRTPIMAEINVVPLVDIVLVILIIFIVSAPLFLTSHIKVELPSASVGQQDHAQHLTLTINAKGEMDLDGREVNRDSLVLSIKNDLVNNIETHIAIAADKNLTHGHVVELIDLLQKNGVKKFSINVIK